MVGTIKIGAVDVPMLANAATEYRYRMIFGSDILTTFFSLYKELGETLDISKADSAQMGEIINISGQLAFVMAKAAEKADMNNLSFEDFITWLEQFESTDILTAAVDIMYFWLNQRKQSVTQKNLKTRGTKGK